MPKEKQASKEDILKTTRDKDIKLVKPMVY